MQTTSHLTRCSPEVQGISSAAIANFVATTEKTFDHLHSFMLLRHGQVVAEGWWYPWRAEEPHMLFSLSKSFTSTAVGLAVAEGYITVDEPVLTFFPGDAPKKIGKNLASMEVRHLLTMTTGQDQDTFERISNHRSPYKAFLSVPVEHIPGTHFVYNSGASFILSAIVQKLTGQSLLEYLKSRLFEPLGIDGAKWESHPNGVNYGGWGLSIKTEDIARFGQLYLQKGQWNGCRILPESWVEEATTAQVSNGDDPNNDWCQGYGYHFWRCRHNIYRGDGAYGQFCIVMPDQEAVLAITAGVTDMQGVLNLVWDKLLPALDSSPLEGNEATFAGLRQSLQCLTFPPPRGASNSPMAETYNGKNYTFEPNYERLRNLRLDFGKDTCKMTYRLLGGGKRRGIHQLTLGYDNWEEGESYLAGLGVKKVAASGVWTSTDTFRVTLCQYETPYIVTITCRFDEEKIILNLKTTSTYMASGQLELTGIVEE